MYSITLRYNSFHNKNHLQIFAQVLIRCIKYLGYTLGWGSYCLMHESPTQIYDTTKNVHRTVYLNVLVRYRPNVAN